MSKYIALDLGTKTIGVATSTGFFANPHSTIRFESENFNQAIELLKNLLNEERPDLLIIGYPKNMDGSVGYRAEMVDYFIELIISNNLLGESQIKRVDERLTTKMARSILVEADLSRKKQKQKKDVLAAVLILETFLQSLA